jgi:hypothetical protein
MNKDEELACAIIDRVSELIEEHYPELKPRCITDDDSIESPALINGQVYYDLELEIAKLIHNHPKFPMRCPRDNAELELVDERMDWQNFRCTECGMKIKCEEGEDDEC